MIGDNDLAVIFDSGDFNVTGTFGTDPDPFDVEGIFTAASQGVSMMSNVEVEASRPSFTIQTSDAGSIRTKMSATIEGDDYIVERVEPVGTGVTVLWLKNSVQ